MFILYEYSIHVHVYVCTCTCITLLHYYDVHALVQVLGATLDGALVNRRLIKLHDLGAQLTFKVKNIHAADGRGIFFFSDPPHLIKTTRNCWSSKCRSLWVCVHGVLT